MPRGRALAAAHPAVVPNLPHPPVNILSGYYGRPFEARNKPKGSAFVGDDKDFFRFTLGSGTVIPGFDAAVDGMRPGGIRRIIVPVELGYPNGDFNKVGPAPTTFSASEWGFMWIHVLLGGRAFRGRLPPAPRLAGATQHPQGKRALSFVLKNQGMIDKTLLFDVELLKVGTRGPLTSAARSAAAAAAGGEEGGA